MFSDIVHGSVGRSIRALPICERSKIKAIFLAALKRTSCAVTDPSVDLNTGRRKLQNSNLFFQLYKVCSCNASVSRPAFESDLKNKKQKMYIVQVCTSGPSVTLMYLPLHHQLIILA